MIGTTIGGEYRVESCLGRGGFGTVYRCVEIPLDRIVAIKVLSAGAVGPAELDRLLGEARNLAALSHVNVVRIYRLGRHEGVPYMVMEYLPGPTLREFTRTERPPLGVMLNLMAQAASGLSAIHAKGIVHRDISASNIMITPDGTAKILDLGLALDLESVARRSAEGILAGTLPYLAPEQISGGPATFASDVFSFGIVLYEALAGRHPFGAEPPLAVLANISHASPTPLSVLCPDLSAEIQEVIARCLAKDPGVRLQDLEGVERALRREQVRADPAVLSGPTRLLDAPARPARAPNPYLNRLMIQRREDFFGRKIEVKRIFARLNASPPGSISIVGDRRIGKSSVLNYICTRQSRETHLSRPDRFIAAYVDLQERAKVTFDSFLRILLGVVQLELGGRSRVADLSPDLEGLKELVQRLHGDGYRLAVILDEFDLIANSPEFNVDFFSFLRYLANHYNVAYLTASVHELHALCRTKEIADSPFFNIFSTMRLGAFSRDEAEELIRVPSAKAGRPLEASAPAILEMAGLFPLFIQIACAHALEFMEENPAQTTPDLREVRRRFREEADPHFEYLWAGLAEAEREVLSRLAAGRAIPGESRHVLEALERKQYVIQARGRSKLFATTFEEFVRARPGTEERRNSTLRRLFRRSGGTGA